VVAKAAEEKKKSESLGNLFVVNDETLLLPEVPSKLNFEFVEDFASDNDTAAQVRNLSILRVYL